MTTHIGTDNILDELRQCGVDVEGSFEDFANVDKKFATTAILTDEDIAAMFLGDAVKKNQVLKIMMSQLHVWLFQNIALP